MEIVDREFGYEKDLSHLSAVSMGNQKVEANCDYIDGMNDKLITCEFGFVETTPAEAKQIAGMIKNAVLIPNTGLIVAPMDNLLESGMHRQTEHAARANGSSNGYSRAQHSR